MNEENKIVIERGIDFGYGSEYYATVEKENV